MFLFSKKICILFFLLTAQIISNGQVKGCTDKYALNYNAKANTNDGSCVYAPITLSPTLKYIQDPLMAENSGMIYWKNLLWQHNDGGGLPVLYATDTIGNSIVRSVKFNNAYNIDWEDITQDSAHIYVGDFGNNVNGARPQFSIYRIDKKDIQDTLKPISISSQKISFTYEDQPPNAMVLPNNKTDFDCEAMLSYNDKLYLFTKQWIGEKTVLYELQNQPGSTKAVRIDSLDVNGLITGADIDPTSKRIVLTGYTKTGLRFIYLLYDFPGNQFFKGNKRKVILTGISQLESVAFLNKNTLALGSESFMSIKQRIEILTLDSLFKK